MSVTVSPTASRYPGPPTATACYYGPLTEAIIQPDIWTDEASREAVGELVLPSGRRVIGDPEAVGRWGPGVAPDDDLDLQAKTGWDEPSPTYLGLVVVARLELGAAAGSKWLELGAVDYMGSQSRFPLRLASGRHVAVGAGWRQRVHGESQPRSGRSPFARRAIERGNHQSIGSAPAGAA